MRAAAALILLGLLVMPADAGERCEPYRGRCPPGCAPRTECTPHDVVSLFTGGRSCFSYCYRRHYYVRDHGYHYEPRYRERRYYPEVRDYERRYRDRDDYYDERTGRYGGRYGRYERQCLHMITVKGSEAMTETGAMVTAKRAWRAWVRSDHGERYQELDHAKYAEYRCWRSSTNESAMGKAGEFLTGAYRKRCQIWAVPCLGERQRLEGDKDDRE